MANDNCAYFTKRIGSTNFKVKIHFSENSSETYSEKIVRLLTSHLITLDDLCSGEEARPEGAA